MTGYGRELRVAIGAAAAGARLLRLRDGAEEVREKGRGDLVTAVDEAAERAVVTALRGAFPDDVVVAEESAPDAARAGRRWIVDPLDGTTNYVHGHPFVCVSVALVDADGPAVGVVDAPLLGEIFHAERGQGGFLNGEPVRVSERTDPSASLLGTGFPFRHGKGPIDAYLRLVGDVLREAQGIRRAGSAALDLAYVACGRLDGFFEPGLAPWDLAAGMLLVTEAGGRVDPWPSDRGSPLESGRIVATNGRIHDWLSGVIASHEEALT